MTNREQRERALTLNSRLAAIRIAREKREMAVCDCGGIPHGKACRAVLRGIAKYEEPQPWKL